MTPLQRKQNQMLWPHILPSLCGPDSPFRFPWQQPLQLAPPRPRLLLPQLLRTLRLRCRLLLVGSIWRHTRTCRPLQHPHLLLLLRLAAHLLLHPPPLQLHASGLDGCWVCWRQAVARRCCHTLQQAQQRALRHSRQLLLQGAGLGCMQGQQPAPLGSVLARLLLLLLPQCRLGIWWGLVGWQLDLHRLLLLWRWWRRLTLLWLRLLLLLLHAEGACWLQSLACKRLTERRRVSSSYCRACTLRGTSRPCCCC